MQVITDLNGKKKKNVPEDDILMYFQKYPEEGSVIFYIHV